MARLLQIRGYGIDFKQLAEQPMNSQPSLQRPNLVDASEERRATDRTLKNWNNFARECLGEFVSTMLNDNWNDDSYDFLLVYDQTSPEHSSIVVCGTGAQVFLGLPSSRFPAAQRLPKDVREDFLKCAARAVENAIPSRKCGTYTDKFGNEVAYRSIFVPTKARGAGEPTCLYGTFSAKFVEESNQQQADQMLQVQ